MEDVWNNKWISIDGKCMDDVWISISGK